MAVCLKYALVFQAVCTDGTLFNHLETLWRFTPAAAGQTKSCNVELFVSSATSKYKDTHLHGHAHTITVSILKFDTSFTRVPPLWWFNPIIPVQSEQRY